jgi:probable rRNA maturation factor
MKVLISNRQRLIKLDLRRIKRDSMKALSLLGLKRAELSIMFAGEARMRALNLRYRGINSPTDVLSFPIFESSGEFPEEGEFPLGDIVINPLRAKLHAPLHGLSLYEELRRLIVHGLLHLMGYEHERGPYRRRKMRGKEIELLEALSG